MRKFVFVLAASGLIYLSACHKTKPAAAGRNADDNVSAALQNQGDMLAAAAEKAASATVANAIDGTSNGENHTTDGVMSSADGSVAATGDTAH